MSRREFVPAPRSLRSASLRSGRQGGGGQRFEIQVSEGRLVLRTV